LLMWRIECGTCGYSFFSTMSASCSDSEFVLWLAEVLGFVDREAEQHLRRVAARLKGYDLQETIAGRMVARAFENEGRQRLLMWRIECGTCGYSFSLASELDWLSVQVRGMLNHKCKPKHVPPEDNPPEATRALHACGDPDCIVPHPAPHKRYPGAPK
jgi:predicted Zn-ribbon and HTH transcriptional regulator